MNISSDVSTFWLAIATVICSLGRTHHLITKLPKLIEPCDWHLLQVDACEVCFICGFQIELDKIVTHRNSIYERLSQPVVTLDELNSAFQLLQELADMENTIDDIYLPVENIYAKLRYYLRNTDFCTP